jgi:hypothetical protein
LGAAGRASIPKPRPEASHPPPSPQPAAAGAGRCYGFDIPTSGGRLADGLRQPPRLIGA